MTLTDVAEMAEAAKVARDVAEAAQADYVAAVRAAIDAGVPVPDIAAAAGVTRTAVYAALRKERARWELAQRTGGYAVRDSLVEYRAAREAQVLAQEARTGGYPGDLALERENGVRPPITWREWLEGRAS